MQHRKGQISRADLLHSLLKKQAPSTRYIATQIGLKKATLKKLPVPESDAIKLDHLGEQTPLTEKNPREAIRPYEGFWYLKQRKSNDKNKTVKKIKTKQVIGWRNRPQHPPQHTPLAPPKEMLLRLQALLNYPSKGRHLDMAKVVKKVANGEHLKRLPKQAKKQAVKHIHVMDDRQRHLAPYWLDHSWLKAVIPAFFNHCRYSQSLVGDGLIDLGSIKNNSTVIILSDLACLSNASTEQQKWLQAGRELQRKKCQTIVLLPCGVERCMPQFKTLFHLESWQDNAQYDVDDEKNKQQLEHLLVLLSPAIRIEPSLLRQLRLQMQTQNKSLISPAIESLVWQHEAIQEPHSVAATWVAGSRKLYLNKFSLLSEAEQIQALDIIKSWRQALNKRIWFEEISSLTPATQQLSNIREDWREARHYFADLSETLQGEQSDAESPITQAWFKRLEQRIPKNSIEASIDLQRISEEVHKGEESETLKYIDPRNLTPKQSPIKQCVLYQQGEYIGLDDYQANAEKPLGYSPLALINLRHDFVQITTDKEALARLTRGQKISLKRYKTDHIKIISDEEILRFEALKKPKNVNIARDKYGLCLELTINNITQKFRYIEPATFLMGSPQNEPERETWDAKESQHQVTLSKGYCLADTTVTQAFYKAVMGKNPSHFKGDNKPVEKVSWEDAKTFIKKLNLLMPTLQASLPSEAQWEYACRSGTKTPFSFGENITPEQVNYDGGYPYHQGEKGVNRKETIAVKSLAANAWGLYEMHGNVWEWCEDAYKEDLGTEAVRDPCEKSEVGAERVLRGGSWIHDGRRVRSANRDGGTADDRDFSVGFRLLLGLELQPSEDKVSQEQSVPQHEQALRDETKGHDEAQIAELKDENIFNKAKKWLLGKYK